MRAVGGVFQCIGNASGVRSVRALWWSVGVVLGAPVLGEDLSFEQTTEGLGGQEFVANASIEGFAVSVFPRCAGFDEYGAYRAEARPIG
jgi:hypothetical protein